jgi:pimeloyl-ACP methyl ester carboxylesterase
MSATTTSVPYRGGSIEIEFRRVNAARRRAPLLVFLHEGLGSVSAWRDFPERLCDAAGVRGFVYSRPGYGRSTARPPDERWTPTYMHEQARDLLPALLVAVGIDTDRDPPWLLGHSDGGSIALIHAATFPDRVAGVVALAPHIFVEDVSIESIRAARAVYLMGALRDRLARHHADPDSAFWGWNDVWLDPAFRRWNIESLLPRIGCPVLAVQGRDDEYGTLAQIEGIARAVPHAERLTLDACGHSLHRDQPDRLIRVVTKFVGRHSRKPGTESWTPSPS